MKRTTFTTTAGASLVLSGLLFLSPLPLSAQDVPQDQQGHMSRQGTTGQQKDPAKRAEWQQHREQMDKMRTEMRQELEQKMTALRAHTKTLDEVTEEKQLLTEMKKHQQMTDALLGTMI